MSRVAEGRSPETRFLIVFLVVVFSLALIGFAIWSNHEDECEKWQEEYREIIIQGGGGNGLLDYINVGPKADLENRRPAGCDVPEGPEG